VGKPENYAGKRDSAARCTADTCKEASASFRLWGTRDLSLMKGSL